MEFAGWEVALLVVLVAGSAGLFVKGLLPKIRRTGPRGRPAPVSNSGVQQASELTSEGRPIRSWADKDSLPSGFLPSDITAT